MVPKPYKQMFPIWESHATCTETCIDANILLNRMKHDKTWTFPCSPLSALSKFLAATSLSGHPTNSMHHELLGQTPFPKGHFIDMLQAPKNWQLDVIQSENLRPSAHSFLQYADIRLCWDERSWGNWNTFSLGSYLVGFNDTRPFETLQLGDLSLESCFPQVCTSSYFRRLCLVIVPSDKTPAACTTPALPGHDPDKW